MTQSGRWQQVDFGALFHLYEYLLVSEF